MQRYANIQSFIATARTQSRRARCVMLRPTARTPVVRVMLTCVLFLTLVSPAAASATASFDPDRALAHARHLAETVGDRPAGSSGEQAAAGWLAGQFAALGYTVRIQPFATARQGKPLIGMNVIASRAGLPGYGDLYAGAHYDTVERVATAPYGGPGANDNAAGVGVLLELARLYATAPLTPTLTLIAFGSEEDGLAGSEFYTNQLPPGARFGAQGMLNFDCVGIGDELRLYYARPEDREFAESLPAAPDQVGRLDFGSSDHASFANAGMPAVLFNMHTPSGPCGPDYHKPTDTYDKLERAAVARVGLAAEAALDYLNQRATPRAAHLQYLPLLLGASQSAARSE